MWKSIPDGQDHQTAALYLPSRPCPFRQPYTANIISHLSDRSRKVLCLCLVLTTVRGQASKGVAYFLKQTNCILQLFTISSFFFIFFSPCSIFSTFLFTFKAYTTFVHIILAGSVGAFIKFTTYQPELGARDNFWGNATMQQCRKAKKQFHFPKCSNIFKSSFLQRNVVANSQGCQR